MTASDTPDNPTVDFASLGLSPDLLIALDKLGFTEPTPIQAAAIPHAMSGRDVVGRARTGSGKTLAFGLPLVHRVRDGGQRPRALVMTPTRELALQVTAAIQALTRDLKVLTVYGGAPIPVQVKALKRGVTVVVGTPGRLRDLVERGSLELGDVEYLVLDEADEMLRMGFIEDVELILGATSPDRQVLLFSASMPKPMRRIAAQHLKRPVEVQVEDQALTVHHIDQQWMRVPNAHKLEVLQRILTSRDLGTTLVFARTRIACAEITDGLSMRGVRVDMLHGGMPQQARERVIGRVRRGGVKVLVATDVAARGIDVEHIGLVVNYDLPDSHERYVHRIGRTARAGRDGVAITLVTPKQKRRLHEMATALGAEILQVEIPTDTAVNKTRRQALRTRVRKAADADLSHAHVLVEELIAVDGGTPSDVAAAALFILAQVTGVELDRDAGGELPKWVRPVQKQATTPYPSEDINEVVLCVLKGKRHKMRPQSIVAALTKDAGVPAGLIGRIRIEPERSLFGVPRAVADTLLSEHGSLKLQGRNVSLSEHVDVD
jgi:ATP-dependent RNA helicase DeaD